MSEPAGPSPIDDLVERVKESPRYRQVCDRALRRLGARELSRGLGLKDAVKRTKNKLHQVAGAYLPARVRYAEWAADLRAATDDPDAMRAACRRVMRLHTSTAERLGILEEFYASTFAAAGPIRSLLDIACGFNPLALSWMPMEPGARYIACDLYHDLAAFLNGFFAACGANGIARSADVLATPPTDRVDLALLLKALPPFEQEEKGSALRLLRAVQARRILVSFPARSLGGRDRGMTPHYADWFLALIADEGWAVERFDFASEVAFLIARES